MLQYSAPRHVSKAIAEFDGALVSGVNIAIIRAHPPLSSFFVSLVATTNIVFLLLSQLVGVFSSSI